MYVVQVWTTPGLLGLEAPIELNSTPGVRIKSVEVEPPNSPRFQATLLEMDGTQGDISTAEADKDMRHLGRVLSRLSFSLLTPFHVFSARLLPKGIQNGDEILQILFPGSPPGIALFQNKLGFRKTVGLNPAFLGAELDAQVEGAISWFLDRLFAPNSVRQVVSHWIGLEMLAPLRRGPWRCSKCQNEVPECPHCHEPTEGPLSVRTIREFLETEIGIEHREFNRLYELRCSIMHGGLSMDPEGLDAATAKAARIQQLLLDSIKKRLNLPSDKPPIIEPHGLTVFGVAGIGQRVVITRPDFYDRPGIFPT